MNIPDITTPNTFVVGSHIESIAVRVHGMPGSQQWVVQADTSSKHVTLYSSKDEATTHDFHRELMSEIVQSNAADIIVIDTEGGIDLMSAYRFALMMGSQR